MMITYLPAKVSCYIICIVKPKGLTLKVTTHGRGYFALQCMLIECRMDNIQAVCFKIVIFTKLTTQHDSFMFN